MKRTPSAQLAAALLAKELSKPKDRAGQRATSPLALGEAFPARPANDRVLSTPPNDRNRQQKFAAPLQATSLWRSSDGEQSWEPCVVHGYDAAVSAFWIEWATSVGKRGRAGRFKRVPATHLRFCHRSSFAPNITSVRDTLKPFEIQREIASDASPSAFLNNSPPATPPFGPEATAPAKKAWRSPTVEAARASLAQWI